MERIVLEVDDEIAKAWRNTSAKLRKKIGKNMEQVLGDSLHRSKEANFDLLLQEMRSEAAKMALPKKFWNIC